MALFVGIIFGLISYKLSIQYPNKSVIFLSTSIPLFFAIKIPFSFPFYISYIIYYTIFVYILSWLIFIKKNHKFLVLIISLILHEILNVIFIFLAANELKDIKFF